MRQWGLLALAIIFLGTTLLFGKLYSNKNHQLSGPSQYPLLASGIFLQPSVDTTVDFQPLRINIQNYFTKLNIKHSFYLEYLSTGANIRDGSDDALVGASLMKIPIVMDLYKAAEEHKISLNQKVAVPANVPDGNDPLYGNTENLQTGQQISLSDAAELTLSASDNTAAYTIETATNGLLSSADQALNNLDIQTQSGTSTAGTYVTITSRSYSSILQCLYFSCFLNYPDSEAVLQDLSNGSTDNSRLRAGLPGNVTIARKLGTFGDLSQSDCGIVYLSNKNYVICVMLDENSAAADKDIANLSKMVFDYINQL